MTGRDDNHGAGASGGDSLAAFRGFYESRLGRMTRHLVTRRLGRVLSDDKSVSEPSGVAVGLGYVRPYLRFLDQIYAQVIGLQSTGVGAVQWPRGRGSRLAVADDGNLPILPSSLDTLLMVHGLEIARNQPALLDECWRVLKSQGRLVLVVPHRGSTWAGNDRTPFGYGQPYSVNQVRSMLKEHDFEVGKIHQALAVPPSHSFVYPRIAPLIERLPRLFGGVLIVDARKMVYSVRGNPATERKRVLRPALIGIKSGLVPGTDSKVE